jgi:hypothetical protein
MKIYNTNYSVGKPYGSIDSFNRGTELEYKKGTYTFKDGVVRIYSEQKFASFSLVINGRIYDRTLSDLKEKLSDRQLLVRAGKFAKDVVQNLC